MDPISPFTPSYHPFTPQETPQIREDELDFNNTEPTTPIIPKHAPETPNLRETSIPLPTEPSAFFAHHIHTDSFKELEATSDLIKHKGLKASVLDFFNWLATPFIFLISCCRKSK